MTRWKKMLLQRRSALMGLVLVGFVLTAALGAGWFARFTPDEMDEPMSLAGICWQGFCTGQEIL